MPIPNVPEFAVISLGSQAYVDVLQDGVAPEQAAAELSRHINRANGTEPTPVDASVTPSPATQTTPGAAGEGATHWQLNSRRARTRKGR